MRDVTRAQVLGFRVRAQQLDRDAGAAQDTTALDLGVQDTGPDGGRWALSVRGVPVAGAPPLVLAWTLRGAPHLYRRADLPAVAAAVAPFSEGDAAKRVHDAARPLRAAGIGVLEALDAVADAMREVVRRPTVKGEVSAAVAARLPAPYLRWCRPCGATHLYEQPFRLAALRAGLELQPGTSPPVLQPVPGGLARAPGPGAADVVRGYLRLLGPATPALVAGYLDAPVRDVSARWPADAVPVAVEGEPRWALAGDVDALRAGAAAGTRLLAPFDPALQARDRALLVPDPARRAAVWPVLGRPGALLVDGEVAGLWRARASGGRLRLRVEPWSGLPARVRTAVHVQGERLAAARGATLAELEVAP